jgi:hypothetical protein
MYLIPNHVPYHEDFGDGVQLHAFLTSAVEMVRSHLHASGAYPRGRSPRYPKIMGLQLRGRGEKNRSGRRVSDVTDNHVYYVFCVILVGYDGGDVI